MSVNCLIKDRLFSVNRSRYDTTYIIQIIVLLYSKNHSSIWWGNNLWTQTIIVDVSIFLYVWFTVTTRSSYNYLKSTKSTIVSNSYKYLPHLTPAKPLEIIRPVSEVEVKEIITQSLSKTCHLGPLPTLGLKKCFDQLHPLITSIINRSMKK